MAFQNDSLNYLQAAMCLQKSTRGTPRVQFANIRKMVLYQGLPRCLRLWPMRRPMHGKSCPMSQLKSTCLTSKFGSFLDHAETGEKGQNVISSNIRFLWFLQVRGLQMTINLTLVWTHISSRHSNLNFAHHFAIYWLFQNGANRESTPAGKRNHIW